MFDSVRQWTTPTTCLPQSGGSVNGICCYIVSKCSAYAFVFPGSLLVSWLQRLIQVCILSTVDSSCPQMVTNTTNHWLGSSTQMNCLLPPTCCPYKLGLSWTSQSGLLWPESTVPLNITFWSTGRPFCPSSHWHMSTRSQHALQPALPELHCCRNTFAS